MSVVSLAIIVSFHFKNEPSALELRMSLPLGIVFWCIGLICLASGFGNYIKTVTKYSRRFALVQTGWRTQLVSLACEYACVWRVLTTIGVCVGVGEHRDCLHPIPRNESGEMILFQLFKYAVDEDIGV